MNLREWIEREMTARGWSRRGLASEADISRGTLDNVFTKPAAMPELDTLAALARVFDTPLWRVVEMAGFESGVTPTAGADRIAQVLASTPELQEIATLLEQVPAADRTGVLLYLQVLQARREASRPGEESDRSSDRSPDS